MSAPAGKTAPTPEVAWPSVTYFTAFHDIYFNGEGIQMIHVPDAVTDGDSLVFFRRSDVIAAGDIFLTQAGGRNPGCPRPRPNQR